MDTPAQRLLKETSYPEACQIINRMIRAIQALDAEAIKRAKEETARFYKQGEQRELF